MSAKVTEAHEKQAEDLVVTYNMQQGQWPTLIELVALALADAEAVEREAIAQMLDAEARACIERSRLHEPKGVGGTGAKAFELGGEASARILAGMIRARGTPAKEKADG